jgi:short-subunit dehydrogenase
MPPEPWRGFAYDAFMTTTHDGQGRWALVTGACSGIGLEIARDLARRGYSVVLVSNRDAPLSEAAQRIAVEQTVLTQAIFMDLARPEAARSLYERVCRLGLPVEVLVTNAGMLLFGEVADTDPAKIEALLHLHVVTPSLLARYFGRDMRNRRSGHILMVSSASAWGDFPGVALYGSSKRYLRSFSAALRHELRPWGVNVTCLAPGAVATGLYGHDDGPAAVAARLHMLSDPTEVATKALDGMFRRKALVLPGASAKFMAAGMAVTPQWLIRLVQSRTDYLPGPRG